MNNLGIHLINRCEGTVTIPDNICVPVMFISGEKKFRGRVHTASDKRFSEYKPSRPLMAFGFFSCFELNRFLKRW